LMPRHHQAQRRVFKSAGHHAELQGRLV
jgi:hypothetical protein